MSHQASDYEFMICKLDSAITEAKRVLNEAQQAVGEEFLFGRFNANEKEEGKPEQSSLGET